MRLTPLEKVVAGTAAVSAAFLLLVPPYDIRWIVGCLTFLLVAYLATGIGFLKGRRVAAAAGAVSVIVLGAIVFVAGLHLRNLSSPGGYAVALLYVMVTLWTVGPLIVLAVVGAIRRAKPESAWVTTRSAVRQARVNAAEPGSDHEGNRR